MTKSPSVLLKDMNSVDYQSAWDYQLELFNGIIDNKIALRKGLSESPLPSHLLLCEHPPTYTIGKSGDNNNMLFKPEQVGAKLFQIERGGDITYHGPGQLVGYPILDLEELHIGLAKYIEQLEETIIAVLKEFNLTAGRIDEAAGVWLDPGIKGKERKIAAIGVKSSRWVTMHGFAFNVNTDLKYFQYIVPCGISDKAVTSLAKELGEEVQMSDVKKFFIQHFQNIFGVSLTSATEVNVRT